ncbi:MAG TPA: hypothetical protein VF628_07345 [Allosphingosinicella sp.]|jgi:hypothetical protein
MKPWILLALGISPVTACDRPAATSTAQPKAITVANPYHERLMGLSELNRSLALRRAIQDSRQPCKRILGSAYQGQYKVQHMWTGRCSPSGDYLIFLAPNGDVQVRSCADAKTLKLPECKLEAIGPEQS